MLLHLKPDGISGPLKKNVYRELKFFFEYMQLKMEKNDYFLLKVVKVRQYNVSTNILDTSYGSRNVGGEDFNLRVKLQEHKS